MKRQTYDKKLQEILHCPKQFTEIENGTDSLILKVEKLLKMKKKQEPISDKNLFKTQNYRSSAR